MSHVDDGGLHAYLDGALDALPASEAARIREHLASCPACALRLEEERRVRAEAKAILAGASPAVGELPSLEELRALAEAGRQPSAGARLRHLGFAASLVLAVGAGWLLRGSQAPRFEGGPMEVPAPAVTEDAAAARQETQPPAPEAVEATEAEEQREKGPPAAEAPAVAAALEEAERESAAPAPAPGATPAMAGGLAALQDSLMGRLQQDRAAAEEAKALGVAPMVVEAARRRADVAPGDSLVRTLETIRPAAGAAAFTPVTTRAAEERGLGVPGLPYLAVTWAPAGLPEGSVRVLQLVDGDTLEVLRVPAGDEVLLPSLGLSDLRTQAALRRGDTWLLGRARIPRERIEALLARIPPG